MENGWAAITGVRQGIEKHRASPGRRGADKDKPSLPIWTPAFHVLPEDLSRTCTFSHDTSAIKCPNNSPLVAPRLPPTFSLFIHSLFVQGLLQPTC